MSNIRIWFQTSAIRDEGDLLCLTDMWRAAGGDESKRPGEWLRHEATREFTAYLETVGPAHSLVRAAEGRSGATWAHWQLGMAYAKYLSPEFHAWCNDVVRAVMQGRAPAVGDTSEALALARDALSFARDATRRLDFIEQHVATGGRIPAIRFAELRAIVGATSTLMVAAKQRPNARAARAAVWQRLREQLGWGGSGQKWAEMPANLEPAARALLKTMHRDAARMAAAGAERQTPLFN